MQRSYSVRAASWLVVVGFCLVGLLAEAQELTKSRLSELFKRADKNGDGKVTAEEYQFPALFKQMDRNSDGVVTIEEAEAFFLKKPEGERKPASITATAKPTEAHPAPVRQGPKILRPAENGVGRLVSDISFSTISGRTGTLSDFKNSKAIVVAMTSTSCPLSRKYLPTLAALEKTYADKGVTFLFVNPVATDSRDEMADFVKSEKLSGPYVHDRDEKLALAVGAKTTTDVIVLDAARTVVYHGAVDDQYGFGYSIDAPRQRYLAAALDAVLAGKSPEVAATEAPGCTLGFEEPAKSVSTVTYHNQIARVLQSHCIECHRTGGVGPFALTSYEDVVAHKGMIKQVVERGVMPPWFAAPTAPPKPDQAAIWRNDPSLTASEKADLAAWFAGGLPLGDPKDAPLPKKFSSQWTIGEPDAVLQLAKPFAVKATGTMPYQNATVETHFDEDKWVQGFEIQPTDRSVVHHVLVFLQPKSGSDEASADETSDERRGFFAAYVPGNNSVLFPEGLAKRLPKGATLRFQLHYTPNGKATVDQTKLGLIFAKQPPQHEVRVTGIVDPRLSIPPGSENHEEGTTFRVPVDIQLLGMMPHMHVRGKAFRYELISPNGSQETLLDVPRYDFNWQLAYRFQEPPLLPRGSTIRVTGWFDNSKNNPANPDPSQTVRWGPQTYDEMLIGYIEYIVPNTQPGEKNPVGLAAGGVQGFLSRDPGIAFQFLDTDKNSKLSRDELGRIIEQIPQLQGNLQVLDRLMPFLDKDGDGEISKEEFQRVKELRR